MFSKKIARMCQYCDHSRPVIQTDHFICPFKGLITGDFSCRKYKYNAIKRVPPKKIIYKEEFDKSDFEL